MNKTAFLILFCLTVGLVQAQNPDQRYVAFLKDKNNNPYTLSNPSEFLSERALERRARYSVSIDQFDLPVTPSYIVQVSETGAQVINFSKWLNTITFLTGDAVVLEAVRSLPFVDSVSSVFPKGGGLPASGSGVQALPGIPPYTIRVEPGVVVGAPKMQSVLNYGIADNQTVMVNLQELHNEGFTGSGMLIAVIDAGFANADQIVAFDSVWLDNRILGWRDLSDPGNDLFAPTMNSHGTSVLSVMAANLPGQIVGTAPHASYFLIRTEEAATESLVEEYHWAAGAELADSLGADVINSSLGYTTFDNPLFNHSYSDLDGFTTPVSIAAGIAASRGMLVVNSAGNSGGGSWQYIGAPADGPQVLSVGAVDNSGQYASFSSTGPTADGRIKPDITAQGQGTALVSGGGDIGWGSGTSFSSPLIAGAMACLWQSEPSRTPSELMDAVKFTASRSTNPDNLYGYGIPHFQAAKLAINVGDRQVLEERVWLVSNPFVNYPTLSLSLPVAGVVGLTLFDLNGRRLHGVEVEVGSGTKLIPLPWFNTNPSGVYIIHVAIGGTTHYLKAVKL